MVDTFVIVLPLMLSPGPANLVSFVLGARNGFSRLLRFQCGIVAVYAIAAIGLGSLTTRINEASPTITLILQILGGLFIVYLGFRLMLRKNREIRHKAPTFASGVLLQALNPKYPGVVLSVFVNRQGQAVLATAFVITLVGAIGLLAYALAGSLFHTRNIPGSGFHMLDFISGSLLCIVGLWFVIQPLLAP